MTLKENLDKSQVKFKFSLRNGIIKKRQKKAWQVGR